VAHEGDQFDEISGRAPAVALAPDAIKEVLEKAK
jgi:hypothetical protein